MDACGEIESWQEGKEMAWGFRTVPSDPTLLPDVYLQTLKSGPLSVSHADCPELWIP